MPTLRPRAALPLLALLVCVPAAAGTTGVQAGPRDVIPRTAKRLGMPCRLDTATFRIWWSDTIGAAGAVSGADGGCRTVPPVVTAVAGVAERARATAQGLGLPRMTGDAPPATVRLPELTRVLLRARPGERVIALNGLGARTRGQYLAGLPAATRVRVLAGITGTVRRRFAADLRLAVAGRPSDFAGGDRRVDVVLDASGVTGMVSAATPGRTSCSEIPTGPRLRRVAFRSTEVVVLAPADTAPAAALAHELFHVVQCDTSTSTGAPDLLAEGTAEWFAARAEPADFAGTLTTGATGQTLSGGATRVARFCTRFDPVGAGLEAYASWGVWQALDAGRARPVRVLAALRSVTGLRTGPTAAAVIRDVGTARWADALQDAARSLCAGLRAPFGDVVFAPGVRGFIGLGSPTATPVTPQTVVVPRWGVASARAQWSGGGTQATIRVTSPDLDAATLVAALVAPAANGPLAATVRDGAAVIDVSGAAITDGAVTVVVPNPRPDRAVTVTVAVEESAPPG
ncbi:MAG: hypothetical protein IT200_03085 [Thermoleophilia bacterium]|nr:hypothetical protein [Thermoleophilia bacterium]